MKPRVLYVFRGPPGSGKTWLRKHLFSDEFPVVDMADAPRNGPYKERIKWMKERFSTIEGDAALEGIYAPESPSWKQLQSIAESCGFIIMSITVTAPIEFCLSNTKGNDDRTEFVHKYHHMFQ